MSKKGLSWIQTLNKNQILEELHKRGDDAQESDKFDDVRERLRILVKKEIKSKEALALEGKSKENESSADNTDNDGSGSSIASDYSSTTDDSSDMSDNVKLEFHLSDGDWETFTEQMELFFIAKNITEDKKAAHLLIRVDTKTFQLIKQLIAPAKITDKKYADIVKVLQTHLKPKPSEIMERCTFGKAAQLKDESVTEFAARLRGLALHCNFTDLENALRDQFVCGIQCHDTKVQLFKKTTLTFDDAYQEALAHETANRNANKVMNENTQNDSSTDDVLAIRRSNNNWKSRNMQSQSSNDHSKVKCYCCGKQGHTKTVCRYKDSTCHSCHKKGHLKNICRSKAEAESQEEKKKRRVQHIHKASGSGADQADDTSSTSGRSEADFYCLKSDQDRDNSDVIYKAEYQCKSDNIGKPMYVNVLINGMDVCMEIDTGTFVTVISEKLYENKFKKYRLEKTGRKLKTYDGKELLPVGKLTNLQTKLMNNKCVLDCYVLPGEGPALIGREWLAKFNLWPLRLDCQNTNNMYKLNVENVVNSLNKKFPKLFSDTPGCYNKSLSKIYLKENVRPIALKCRPVAHALIPLVESEIERLLKLGHLKQVEISEWATPIVPIFKSNKKIRICGDFKVTLNEHLTIDKYPLHTIDDIFTRLQGGHSFSELDLTHAYMQFPVDEESSKLLTIVTHKGLFRYTKITEGVAPAPADIQRKMDECLRGLNGVIAYLDNIYVTGKTDEEHLENLHKVCKRLEECNLRLNKNKCFFMKQKLDILGFVIDKSGLHKSKSKVNAMLNAPQPKNAKELESFLGLINFYARFLTNRSVNLKPLYDMLHSKIFAWNDECTKAFKWVKNELASPRVLVNYDPNEKLILACDASNYGLSAILSHKYSNGKERPIAFASKKITKSELNRKILDKEAMAIVFGCKKFYQFIFGKSFILRTDNKALEYILGPRKGIPQTADNRLQRWAYFLSGFRYIMEHVNSKANANCDALSRLPVDDNIKLTNTKFSHVYFFDEGLISYDYKILANESKTDKEISQAIKYVMQEWPSNDTNFSSELKSIFAKRLELCVEKDCLFWGLRAIIPKNMRKVILNELHATHLGIVKIKMFARSYVWWPGINNDIERMVRDCNICIIERKKPPHTPLTTWPYPSKAWGRIHCDFAELYGKSYLLIIDAHSKWPEIICFNNNTKSDKLISEFKKLFARHGFPLHCVTDGGPQFRSDEFCKFLTNNGVKHSFSPPYHPATNGAAENIVQIFKDKVKKIVKGGETVDNAINMFLFDYRSIDHCTTGRSPAYLLYKRELRTRFDKLRPNVFDHVDDKQRAQIVAKSGNRSVDFEIGDKVYVDDHGVRAELRKEATIVRQDSPSTFVVVDKNDKRQKRHVDQMVSKEPTKLRRSPRLN